MNRLKMLRKDKNLTQQELAKIINMSQTGYSQYERNERKIPITTIKKLANYFEVSVDYLSGLTDIKDKYKNSKIINNENNILRLKEIREDKDYLQKDIAKVLNMSRKAYSHYESYYSEIPLYKLKKLALFYNVSIDYLLYLTDERVPYTRKEEM